MHHLAASAAHGGIFAHLSHLPCQFLDDLFSFLHNAQVRLVHLMFSEQVFGVNSSLGQKIDFINLVSSVQVKLRNDLSQFDNVTCRLLLLELYDKVLQLVDSLREALSVSDDWILSKLGSGSI